MIKRNRIIVIVAVSAITIILASVFALRQWGYRQQAFVLLTTSSQDGNIPSMNIVLEKYPDLVNEKDASGKTPLHHAVFFEHVEAVKYLLDSGARIDLRDDYGRTPLDYYSSGVNLDMDKLLQRQGAERSPD